MQRMLSYGMSVVDLEKSNSRRYWRNDCSSNGDNQTRWKVVGDNPNDITDTK
jgi:hypothetical protein